MSSLYASSYGLGPMLGFVSDEQGQLVRHFYLRLKIHFIFASPEAVFVLNRFVRTDHPFVGVLAVCG